MKEQVFEFIKKTIKDTGLSPTINEICQHFNWKAVSTAYSYKIKLAIEGRINWGTNKKRSIFIIEKI
jgi:repressor LexA